MIGFVYILETSPEKLQCINDDTRFSQEKKHLSSSLYHHQTFDERIESYSTTAGRTCYLFYLAKTKSRHFSIAVLKNLQNIIYQKMQGRN